jgi:2-oxoglutarate dehydrogenase E2 component (dihydrolipoamide succinyltransferase)
MPVELRVPAIGESITEVQIAAWLRSPGETVRQDEPIVLVETEKASLELPAPVSGILRETLKKPGETATIGEVIAYLEESPAAVAGEPGGTPGPAEARRPAETSGTAETPPSTAAPSAAETPAPIMPAARELLAEHGVPASAVRATSPDGRLDVLGHLDTAAVPAPGDTSPPPSRPAAGVAPPAPVAAVTPPPPVVPPTTAAARRAGAREEEAVPMSMLRRRVAERLVQAQRDAALLTTFNEVDMSAVTALRRAHQEAFRERHGVKLGLMSFFVRAAIEALKRIPALNAEIRGTQIVYRNYHDIGVAVGGNRGLVVPVLRNAETMSFAAIDAAIADFARRAEAGTLTLDELQGGTFTISNGGVYGSLLSTPIVNPPQSGILGLHAIQDRPVARDGQVVIRPMMYVALTYDHRIVDGREAVTFLRHIKASVEEPSRILLEI